MTKRENIEGAIFAVVIIFGLPAMIAVAALIGR